MYSGATSIAYRFYDSDDVSFDMREDAQVGSSSCWGGQVKAAKCRTSFPVALNVDNGGWRNLEERNVVNPSTISSMSDRQAILVEGDESAFVAAFVWGTGSFKKYYFVTSNTTSVSVPNPSITGYDFIGWSYVDKDNASKNITAGSSNTTVKISGNISSTRAMNGTQEITLAAGSTFDFTMTILTNNITLKASKNGKCVCGAEKPTTTVTLEETYGNRDSTLIFTSKPKKDSEVTLVAPSMGTDQFVKWEYRSLNGSTWQDLISSPVVGFIIPSSIRSNAVYQSLTSPQLTLTAEHYSTDGLLFTMQYVLPKGWKATDAAVIL